MGAPEISDAQIYNNTIVNPAHAVSTGEDIPGFVYRNNIFLTRGDVLVGPFSKSRFENNLYWSDGKGAIQRDGKTVYAPLEAWSAATKQEIVDGKSVGLFADPKLVVPEKNSKLPASPKDLAAMLFFRLREDSACVRAGTIIKDSGGRDFFGGKLTEDERPSIGAHEPQKLK